MKESNHADNDEAK